jgi:hypothetical protein
VNRGEASIIGNIFAPAFTMVCNPLRRVCAGGDV